MSNEKFLEFWLKSHVGTKAIRDLFSCKIRFTQHVPVVSTSRLWAAQYTPRRGRVFVPKEKPNTCCRCTV